MDKITLAFKESGGPAKLASTLGVSIQRVVNWKRRGRIPPEWVVPVSNAAKAAGGSVTPHDLAPDVFQGVEQHNNTTS